jgi:hypothetical protein
VIVESSGAGDPAPQPGQVGPDRRFVDKDKPVGGPLFLHRLPELSLSGGVSAILFAGPQRFF